mmetsp:Transcript_25600/g.65063  ORF Transcript_25600/g.65063 Transcript_25600/m.65063 type:complete len:231 (-) Transcript_25600:62-754(-)
MGEHRQVHLRDGPAVRHDRCGAGRARQGRLRPAADGLRRAAVCFSRPALARLLVARQPAARSQGAGGWRDSDRRQAAELDAARDRLSDHLEHDHTPAHYLRDHGLCGERAGALLCSDPRAGVAPRLWGYLELDHKRRAPSGRVVRVCLRRFRIGVLCGLRVQQGQAAGRLHLAAQRRVDLHRHGADGRHLADQRAGTAAPAGPRRRQGGAAAAALHLFQQVSRSGLEICA